MKKVEKSRSRVASKNLSLKPWPADDEQKAKAEAEQGADWPSPLQKTDSSDTLRFNKNAIVPFYLQ